MKKLLHLGAGGRYYEGFINSDMRDGWKGRKHHQDLVMDVSQPWPYEDNSIDGIVSMHLMQQIQWRGLVIAFREAYRVLKPGGVLRMGCPMVEHTQYDLDYLLGWNNITLFSFDLLYKVLVDRIGFRMMRECGYQDTDIPEFKPIDNRKDRGTKYYECLK